MESFKLFFEERVRPDVNQKKSTWEYLEKYIKYNENDNTFNIEKRGKHLSFNADDVYIHFGSEFKVGINPQSGFDVTPLGIYCYHLKTVWERYKMKNNPMSVLPYAGREPFCWVLIYTGDKSKLVSDITKFSKSDLTQSLPAIKKFFAEKYPSVNSSLDFKQILDIEKEKIHRSFFNVFWRLTDKIASKCAGDNGDNIYFKNALYWNVLLRKCGYVGFNDTGHGVIFDDEPYQAVFLQKDVLKAIDVIHNKYFDDVDKQFIEFLAKNKAFIHYDKNQLPILTEYKDFIFKLKFWSGSVRLDATDICIAINGINKFTLITGFNESSDINCSFRSMTFKNSKIDMPHASFQFCDFVNCDVTDGYIIIRSEETTNSTFKGCRIKISSNIEEVKRNNTFIGCEFV